VNHILSGKGWDNYGEFEKVFTFWRSPDATPPGLPEDIRLHARLSFRTTTVSRSGVCTLIYSQRSGFPTISPCTCFT